MRDLRTSLLEYGKHLKDVRAPSNFGRTTMVVSNIPPQYTVDMLLEEWPNNGTYDLLHLSGNAPCTHNAGHGLVNFASEVAALSFRALWKGRHLAHFGSKKRKPLQINFSPVQGHTSIDILKRMPARARRGAFQPVLFAKGERIAPTGL